MISQRNEFHRIINLLIFYIITSTITLQCFATNIISENRICTSLPFSRFRLNLGNVAVVSHGGETETPDAANNASVPSPDRCFIKIITCPYCHLTVSIDYLEMAPCTDNNTFRCDHLVIREPEYENSITEFYSTLNNYSKIYESRTRNLYVEYFSTSFGSNFSFTIKSIENIYKVKGHSLSYRWNYTSIIESPHFPLPYPSDYSSKHILENLDKRGFIRLIFSDFTLSPYSFIEILDSNGTKLEIDNGNSFRPPVITSSGQNLTVNFKANDELPNLGFRATVYFISFYGKHMIHPPITDCGGLVEDYGGTITMSNVPNLDYLQSYDCVWIIRPRISSNHETHLSVKVVEFENFDSGSNLRIHEGLTSQSYLLETVTSNQSHKGPSRSLEYIAHLSTGFYIRLHGYFTNESKMAIVYSAFRYDPCVPVKDFRCNNGRCIKPVLHCDGYTHCGDGSDEQSCFNAKLAVLTGSKTDGNVSIIILHPKRWKKGKGRYIKPPSRIIISHAGTLSPEDEKWWRTLTPNYYFPKQETSSGAGTNTLILITSLAGLGMFILTTALILVKLHKQKREDAINREVLSTISAEIAESNSSSLRSNFGSTPSDPPVYDPPPSYEDVVKFYLPPSYLSACLPRIPTSSTTTEPPCLPVPIIRPIDFSSSNNNNNNNNNTSLQIPNNNQRQSTLGVENAAFIPDIQSNSAIASTTSNQRRFLSPPLLTVILPATRLLGFNPVPGIPVITGGGNNSSVIGGRNQVKLLNTSSQKDDEQTLEAKEQIPNRLDDNLIINEDQEIEQPLPSYETACCINAEVDTCACVGACACSASTSSTSGSSTSLEEIVLNSNETSPTSSSEFINASEENNLRFTPDTLIEHL